ncbi:TetR/AcrR family transcriptional regulator [Nocardia cyriacigeorgica]|uniref:TetR/AcrR family transcriptional regulator n=1 Tax=Nocardia cyriacigeorgica TaxID=135487 RepID=UPI0018962DA0|nr:TetR/AcrR family transcriptional regulator [Nocardia cyriacigeorgica]MBF6090391.1 TetR/AcrR family transcriptional regulator [Nocardia cyriacigeorgica]MBF6096232.1 TetR/AcrR family transcriptional regulator [Nocardia cyriacigeorgica]MBF6101346.1 TetR/AcrR family transcriptional regulator [Nocardia cyriacigeorgica]MBF6397746.1 TetR/AcrR family transcriptional regulator [Nocardia cyriacigeorgica]MBF6402596.1 TetR/AcrR family transcriptional regulator [Nocardia cyriacigeorgica]
MTTRTDSRQRFIDAAVDLFHTQGYHATGLNQLVTAGGAPKGSLYFHFPGGKEQLAAEALDQAGKQLRERLAAVLDHGDIDAVVDLLATNLVESDFTRACPLASVALDAADSEPIRAACAGGFESWRVTIAEYLRAKGIGAERAEQLSTVALAMVEGALLLAKTNRDTAPLRAVADHLRTLMDQELSR